MSESKKVYDFSSVGETLIQKEERVNNQNITYNGRVVPIGIKTPMEFTNSSSSVFKMHFKSKEQIEDNIRNLVLTNKGERLMMPEYGANIKELIMEIGTESGDQLIMERIKSAVQDFMPFIKLVGYQPIKKVDENGTLQQLSSIITFSAPDLSIFNMVLELNFYEAI